MRSSRFLPLPVIAVVMLSTMPAKAAWSWWSGYDNFAECVEYQKDHLYKNYTAEQSCLYAQMAEDEKRRNQEQYNRMIILECRSKSVSNAQFAACVELAMSAPR